MLSSMRARSSYFQAPNTAVQITTGPLQTLTIDASTATGTNLIGHPNANLYINGGGGMSLAFTSLFELGSLVLNRLGGTVTMSSPITVGSIAFRQGVIVNPAGILVAGNTPDSVIQESSSSQLFGPLTRTIAPNTNAATYIWPVGKYYVPAQNLKFDNVTTGPNGNVLVQAEPFEGNSGGTTDSTLSSLKTNNYWKATVVSNASNLISVGKVSLIDYRVAPTDVIGYATSLSGVYTSLGGSVSGFSNTSTLDSPTALGYYNFATVCIAPTLPTINTSSIVNCGTVATTLNIANGTLNSAPEWKWYSGSCGGTLVGTGNSIVVFPTATTSYFVRGEGGCVTSGECAEVTITVNVPGIWYADADGDSFGDPNVSQLVCVAPGNYVSNNTDCNDASASINPNASEVLSNGGDDNCDGTIDEVGPAIALIPSQCGAILTNVATTIYSQQSSIAEGYRFEVTNGATVRTYDSATNSFSLLSLQGGVTYATTYTIRVAVKTNGFWRNYSSSCTITTPAAAATTNVIASQCGTTLANIANVIYANQVTAANQYRFEVTDTSTSIVRTFDTALNRFSLSNLSGGGAFGATYSIRVALRFGTTWEPFGTGM